MLLSVIIPAYRTAATLRRCVESVLASAFDGEVILVDDGSPDEVPAICDQLARECDRVRAIHQPNGGLSRARNAGLQLAQGQYVTFVDSDDYIAPGSYEHLLHVLAAHPEYDVLEYPVWERYGSPAQHLLTFTPRTCRSVLDYWLKEQAYRHTYAWNKIFRRALLEEIRFAPDRLFEDAEWLPRVLALHPTIGLTDAGLYYYCWNEQGITAQADGHALDMLLDAHLKVIEKLPRLYHTLAYQRYYLHVANIQLDVCSLLGTDCRLPRHEMNPCLLLSSHRSAKEKVKLAAIYLLGVNFLCCIYRVRKRVRTRR